MLRPIEPSPSGLLNLESERGFEDSRRTGRPSIITTDHNIEAIERMIMRDQQISVRRVAYESPFPTTTIVYEIITNHLG